MVIYCAGNMLDFDFVERGSKAPHLCQVKWCRNKRAPQHRTCSKCQMKRWRARYPLRAAFTQVRQSAARRGKVFDLTIEQFAAVVLPAGYLERKGHRADNLHIDRERSELGYEVGNIRVITNSENITKENQERKHRRQMVPDPF